MAVSSVTLPHTGTTPALYSGGHRFSTRRQNLLSEIVLGIPQFLQVNAGITSQIRLRLLTLTYRLLEYDPLRITRLFVPQFSKKFSVFILKGEGSYKMVILLGLLEP
jgi:hypothetical protein